MYWQYITWRAYPRDDVILSLTVAPGKTTPSLMKSTESFFGTCEDISKNTFTPQWNYHVRFENKVAKFPNGLKYIRFLNKRLYVILGISYVNSSFILWMSTAAQYMRCLIISQLRSANKSLYNIVLSMYYHAYSYTIIQVNMAFVWKNEEMLWLMSWKRKNYKCYIAAI